MIRYALKCPEGHEFDQWFANMAAFDQGKDELTCPTCDSKGVEKAIMAPRIGSARPAARPAPPCGAPACPGGGCGFLSDRG